MEIVLKTIIWDGKFLASYNNYEEKIYISLPQILEEARCTYVMFEHSLAKTLTHELCHHFINKECSEEFKHRLMKKRVRFEVNEEMGTNSVKRIIIKIFPFLKEIIRHYEYNDLLDERICNKMSGYV